LVGLCLLSACGEDEAPADSVAERAERAFAAEAPVRKRAEENLRALARLLVEHRKAKGKWPPLSGKTFVLALVAEGAIERTDQGLSALFSPGDKYFSVARAGGAAAYDEVTPTTLAGRDYRDLTSYAGRRNAEAEYMIRDDDVAVPILADFFHLGTTLIAYSDGAVRWHTWKDLGITVDPRLDPENVTADMATSPLLRCLAAW
jgi:hypothetical protein